ncbi:hypothetical protein EG830_08035, partial [bacterium]|nr:hypothetical protein [bacterium]
MKIRNKAGLAAEILENGAVGWIEASPVMISLRKASVYSGAYANVWLRKRGMRKWFLPLTGPGSESRFRVTGGIFFAVGNHEGIGYTCTLRLSDKSLSWEWRIDLHNGSGEDTELDLVCLQDAGLKTATPGLVNEYYVSQYTERRILVDPVHGKVVCCRQNMKESGGYPWMMMASLGCASSGCTDGMQFYGRSYRTTGIPEALLGDSLGGEYAGESSVVALQEEPFVLPSGESRTVRFAGTFLHNHTPATSEADLDRLHGLEKEFSNPYFISGVPVKDEEGWHSELKTGLKEEKEPGSVGKSRVTETDYPEDSFRLGHNLFSQPVLLKAEDLEDDEMESLFPGNRRHEESAEGKAISFFSGDNSHVM